jgi:hypothetical protein
VIVVGDEVVLGFNRPRLAEVLGIEERLARGLTTARVPGTVLLSRVSSSDSSELALSRST